MDLKSCKAYEIIEQRRIEELNSESFLLRHKKTGARVALLSNDDENKVFYIGFRTPPKDSTGVAHILEHSVLCGSRHFPVKDPFIELAQGSLNTFLNAMTYPDKTVYPVASCNDQDFKNLMHVYMDAVFYPNIYKEEKIFRQEGWHYQLEDEADELRINGVVYNEMKGAFSSPDDVLDREVFNSLFPETPYGVESGGDPACIPDLTYQDFLDFHGRYYHPSNSYIYLYGNMDMAERLEWMDQEYLSRFEAISIDSEIGEQACFCHGVEVKKQYPITDSEPLKENGYLAYNTVIGSSLDRELYVAFQILDYVLCSAPGAPLKQALTDAGIGREIYSVYENGIQQPYFSVVSKHTDISRKEDFLTVVRETLERLCEQGIDKKALRAAVNYYEFKYREADFGSYPKGLMYGLQALDSWLYDENRPFLHVEAADTFRLMRERVGTDYFEKLIGQYLLDNPHSSVVMVEPVRNLAAREEKAQRERLAALKESMSGEELAALVSETKALAAYQEAPDTKEAVETIPLLRREDMKKEAEAFYNRVEECDGTVILHHDIFTNGIGYVRLLFNVDNIPKAWFPYLAVYKAVLGLMNTKEHSYGDFFNEVNLHTGGISTALNVYTDFKNPDRYQTMFEIRTKVFYEKLEYAFGFMREMILDTVLTDEKRLREIIGEARSRVRAGFMSGGHTLAALRALSYFSGGAAISEQFGGLSMYRLLEEIDDHFDERKQEVITKLTELTVMIFRPENLMVDYTAQKEGGAGLREQVQKLREALHTEPVEKEAYVPRPSGRNEGIMSSAQVQYVCRAGNFVKKGFPYTGALKVLKVMMGYEYLWSQVRVRGGAYGCMCSFGRTGDSYFVSYRDPNLEKTIEAYMGASEFVRTFEADERTMTKFIIGAVSETDMPLTPAAKGGRSLLAYLTHATLDDLQKERDEMLQATPQDIRKLADYLDAFLSFDCLCVVGNEEKIREQKALFGVLTHLSQGGEDA